MAKTEKGHGNGVFVLLWSLLTRMDRLQKCLHLFKHFEKVFDGIEL